MRSLKTHTGLQCAAHNDVVNREGRKPEENWARENEWEKMMENEKMKEEYTAQSIALEMDEPERV